MLSLLKTFELTLQNKQKITVYPDDEDAQAFYVLPSQPRFRLRDDGTPYFTFIKYKDRTAEGAWCYFDTMFAARPEELVEIEKILTEINGVKKPVKLSAPRYSPGATVNLLAIDSNNTPQADEKVFVLKASKFNNPSSFGDDIASFEMKLTPLGSTLYQKALSQGQGAIQLAYGHKIPARMGAFEVRMKFSAKQTANFLQEISSKFKKDDSPGGLAQTVTEGFTAKKVGDIEITDNTGRADDASKQAVRNWAIQLFKTECETALEKLTGVTPEEKKKFEEMANDDINTYGGKKISWLWFWYYKQMEERKSTFTKNVTSTAEFEVKFRENTVFEIERTPQGMLDNVCKLKKTSGELVKWTDVSSEIMGIDEFFRDVKGKVIIAWEGTEGVVSSVQVFVKYGTKQKQWNRTFTPPPTQPASPPPTQPASPPPAQPGASTKPEEPEFGFNYEKDVGEEYEYRYEVKYIGETRSLKTGWQKDTGDIIITTLGVLAIDVVAGNLEKKTTGQDEPGACCIKMVLIDILYEDTANNVKISRHVSVPVDHGGERGQGTSQTTKIRAPIFVARTPSYKYKGKYAYHDGLIFETPWEETSDRTLKINDPLFATQKRTVAARFDDTIDRIDVILEYKDSTNNYSIETTHTFEKEGNADAVSDLTWVIPVAGGATGNCTIEWVTVFKEDTGIPSEKSEKKTFRESKIEVGPKSARREKNELEIVVSEEDDWDTFWNKVYEVGVTVTFKEGHDPIKASIKKPKEANKKGEPLKTYPIFLDDFSYDWTATYKDKKGKQLKSDSGEGTNANLTIFLSLPKEAAPVQQKELEIIIPEDDWDAFWNKVYLVGLTVTFKDGQGNPIKPTETASIKKPKEADAKDKPLKKYPLSQDNFSYQWKATFTDKKGKKLEASGEGTSADLTIFLSLPE